MINSFFYSIGEEIGNDIDYLPNPLLSGDYTVNVNNFKFAFKPVNDQEFRDAITKLKRAKSFGNGSISSFFLKLALPFIASELALLFNTSIATSKFPDL